MSSIKNLSKKLLKRESIRFIVAGSFNTLCCYLIFIMGLLAGLAPWLAMTIATAITICVGFVVMARFVFGCTLTLRRSMAFVVMQGIGYLININILSMISRTGLSDYFAGIMSLLVTAVFTFLISKYIVFFKRQQLQIKIKN
ncbi:MAG: GtrA family protein [Methylobacter sp.]|uniref:GtrA family protein n=1 Tax=Methylobacter sp. TaxID=2051955 RepID=UPI00272FEFE6|nr:GtrA family protein [Methylobacter sp.]MDP1665888.1 GtrA family protein [Methylobacter sp.]